MPPTNAHSAEDLVRCAQDLLAAGAPVEAARTFRAAIDAADAASEPGAPLAAVQHAAHLGLVRALRAAGRLEPSIGAALALAALAPSDTEAHLELATSLFDAGHIAQARMASARGRVLAWRQELERSADPGSAAGRP